MKPTDRSIRFVRAWGGRLAGAIGTPGDLGYGQRHTLVTHGFAKWIEPVASRQKQTRQLHKEHLG